MVKSGSLEVETLIAFMLYQGQLQSEVLNLFSSYTSLIKSSGAGDKVFQLIDRTPDLPATGAVSKTDRNNSNQHSLDSLGSIIIQNVTFNYNSRPNSRVLKNVSLRIPKGSTCALIGESGSGKSTLISLVERFYDPVLGRLASEARWNVPEQSLCANRCA